MLTDVDAKGRGGPPPNGLDMVQRDAGLGESGGATAAHGLAGDVPGEMRTETGMEPFRQSQSGGWRGKRGHTRRGIGGRPGLGCQGQKDDGG
jgi:hypothetical protein